MCQIMKGAVFRHAERFEEVDKADNGVYHSNLRHFMFFYVRIGRQETRAGGDAER